MMQPINRDAALLIRPSEIRDARELIVLDNMIWTENTTPGPLMWRSREDYLLHAPPGSQLVALQEGSYAVMSASAVPAGWRATAMYAR